MKGQVSSDDDYSSDEETNQVLIATKKTTGKDAFDQTEESGDENSDEEHQALDSEDEEVEEEKEDTKEAADEQDDQEHTSNEEIDEDLDLERLKKERLERLKKMRTVNKGKHKTGVVYLSKIPPYMKPAKMRQLLSRFGDVDRLFLKREDDQKHKTRVRGGGNKKVMFEEGWIEFVRKKDAKLCAETMNGNIIGGKKGNFYHDDVMNVKYLSGFKWADLTEQIARENDIRQTKLQLEVSQANKMNAEFIRNVERSKMLDNIRASKKRNSPATKGEAAQDGKSDHVFKQRRVTTNRAAGPEKHKQASSERLNTVIENLF
ncbi:LANO_0A00452g1_1 [Lachancea nothofagi CBS 11611]|uniref:Pre-rRNA-processing protein ESF2 n=1 Tax=Lachancea nothofagi CBS 11611 TaxID=1266666 RepID=A0A1G4ILL4_9SACH|nr:LANO_0A00452g1_1 [Lachancea nothofagi CBS 11611]